MRLSGAQTGAGVIAGHAGTVEVAAEGVTTVTYFATDAAGNVEAPKSLAVHIDRSRLLLSGLPAAGCASWPADHRLVEVAAVSGARTRCRRRKTGRSGSRPRATRRRAAWASATSPPTS